MTQKSKEKVVVVSGPFDPMHIGHVRYMQEAKALGDKLIVILNNDHWYKLKGKLVFMPQEDRKEIIEALECVDEVILSSHAEDSDDFSVCVDLERINPDIFAKGGDRFAHNTPEFVLCQKLGIEMVFNVGHGGKIRHSSEILSDYVKKHTNWKKVK